VSVRINPSILSADFANFESELQTINGCDLVHVDVMDNHFVPNLTFGQQMVSRLQQLTPKPLDLHLMIENPERWAPDFAETGAYSVTFHAEATSQPVELARRLRAIGARAGIAIKPGTNLEPYLEILPEFDQLLVMTVEPGFGGQALIEDTLKKVSAARRYIDAEKLDVWLQVDGGIDENNIERVSSLGADTFVAGSAVFKAADRNAQIELLRRKAAAGCNHRHA
jgi:ribulose-phosphate 3-epimerase